MSNADLRSQQTFNSAPEGAESSTLTKQAGCILESAALRALHDVEKHASQAQHECHQHASAAQQVVHAEHASLSADNCQWDNLPQNDQHVQRQAVKQVLHDLLALRHNEQHSIAWAVQQSAYEEQLQQEDAQIARDHLLEDQQHQQRHAAQAAVDEDLKRSKTHQLSIEASHEYAAREIIHQMQMKAAHDAAAVRLEAQSARHSAELQGLDVEGSTLQQALSRHAETPPAFPPSTTASSTSPVVLLTGSARLHMLEEGWWIFTYVS